MHEPTGGVETSAQKSDAKPALLGVACGLGAALFWALGFVATRHGLKVGFTPADLLMHRFVWSGLAFLPLVLRAGLGNLCGIGWGRGLALMVLGGPVMSIISYTGFLFVPLGHGSVIQPSCATLGGLFLAAVLLRERISLSRFSGAVVIVAGLAVIGGESIGHIGQSGVLGDLIFVLTGFMFAGFATLVRLLACLRLLRRRRHQRALALAVSGLCGIRRARPGGGDRPRRECAASAGARHPGRTRGDVSVRVLDPASRRRPRRGIPRDRAGADPAGRLAAARRAAERAAGCGTGHGLVRVLSGAAAALAFCAGLVGPLIVIYYEARSGPENHFQPRKYPFVGLAKPRADTRISAPKRLCQTFQVLWSDLDQAMPRSIDIGDQKEGNRNDERQHESKLSRTFAVSRPIAEQQI